MNDELMTLFPASITPTSAVTQTGMTAWRRIAEELQVKISTGAFQSGGALPSSVELAEQYGVHRHTIRQAFRHLADLGLVIVERGRGTRVLPPRFPYRLGRQVSLRANFGAAGISVEGKMINRAIIDAPQHIRDALGLGAGAKIWRIRTVSLAGGIPVSTAVHALDASRFPDFPDHLAAHGASITAALKASGIEEYNRLSTRLSARIASEREAALLNLGLDAPVLQSIAVDALPDLTAIHMVMGVFAGERMEIVVEPFRDA